MTVKRWTGNAESILKQLRAVNLRDSEPCSCFQAQLPPDRSFFDLPAELRCRVYRAMVSSGAIHDYVGLLLSCKQVYHEATVEFVTSTSEYLEEMESRFNTRLPAPIRIAKPLKFADLSRITIHLPNELFQEMVDRTPYMQLIDRILILGRMRSGFPRPSAVMVYNYVVTTNYKRLSSSRINLGVEYQSTAFKRALDWCDDESKWSLTISTASSGRGYRMDLTAN